MNNFKNGKRENVMVPMKILSRILVALAMWAGAMSCANAQVMTIPLPGSQAVLGSLSANVILESNQSNVTVLTNTRTALNSVGATVNAVARIGDWILTNGGNSVCYINFTDASGNLLLGEVAVPPYGTTSLSLANAVPVVGGGGALRAVKSDLFGAACASRLVITVRGFYSYIF
jgi:hypothetical protein